MKESLSFHTDTCGSHKQDNLLIKGVCRFGHNWKTIAQTYFPRRTALAAKNRHSLLCRRIGGGNQQPNAELARQKRARISIATASPLSNQRNSLSICSNMSRIPDQLGSDEEVGDNDGGMSSEDEQDEGYSEDNSVMGNNPQIGGLTTLADVPNLIDLSHASARPQAIYPQNPIRSSYDVLRARPTMGPINRSQEEQSSQRHGIQSGQATTCDYTYSDFSSDAFADFDALQRGFMQAATSAPYARQHSFNTCASNMFTGNESQMQITPMLSPRGAASLDAEMGYSSVITPHRDSDGFFDQRPYTARSNAYSQLLSPELSQQASPEPPLKGPDRVTENDVAKQVTITALCSGMQLGKLVQTVTELASSVTVLIAEPPSI